MRGRRVHLKMMWDYDAFPLWSTGRALGEQINVDLLPLSTELRDELQAWSDEWTGLVCGEHGPDAPGWKGPTTEQHRRWDEHGRQVLARTRAELGPKYVVGYFNENTHEIEWPDDRGAR